MNKKLKKIILILTVLLLTSSIVYANLDQKMGNHWSKGTIERNFLNRYFPYLAERDYSKFNPNGKLSTTEFSKSVSLLFKNYNLETQKSMDGKSISRERMLSILGEELKNSGVSPDGNVQLPFKDIANMNNRDIELLKILYKAEVIQGDSNGQFAPNRELSQAEAIITLQRTRSILNSLETYIPFKVVSSMQSFNGKEGIAVIPKDEKVIVTITKQFPTPGYDMEVKNIVKTKQGHKINFEMQGPSADMIQLQVITYKTITLEIDKGLLGDSPYNFILEGYK